ncbi:hypothetical protein L202_02256 [Cryptococcus amylolentus CBS 6039]|uniref:alpha-galactosidase n=1 Tax=Cryptococcus amylolentus CBS 6039 TaxID=1295533 RepID=A0A1E3HZZ9_9TREE|nr:hypothetical protein L202_02256 [Cryptococcus amylolentus CBS 6039]ODN81912.1 hypothetical protein L202_02256 [Cryptococcus amylolentus CBS 6039]
MLPTAVLFSILFFFRPALGAPACRSSQTDDESASSITSHQSEVGTTIISATSIIATSTEIASSTSTASATSPSATGNATSSVALDSTFLYELDATSVHSPIVSTNTGLSVDGQVYIVDAEGTSAETIAQYKANGKTVICYFSAGTWEPNRPDASSFDASCVCAAGESFTDDGCTSDENKLDGWDEWWLDIHSDSCKTSVQSVMTTRIEKAAAKGCDGVDLTTSTLSPMPISSTAIQLKTKSTIFSGSRRRPRPTTICSLISRTLEASWWTLTDRLPSGSPR